jgi:hypothetical protein
MINRDRFFEQMVLAYYGELSPDERRRFDELLDSDPELRRAYGILAAQLDALTEHTAVPVPDAHDEFWTALEYNIKRRIRAERSSAHRMQSWNERIRTGLAAVLRPAIALTAVAAAFVLGMLLGTSKQSISPEAHSTIAYQTQQGEAEASPVTALPTAIADPVRSFLKRSQVYIATTADKQLKCERCIPIERQLDHRHFAHELLKEAQRLRPLAHRDPNVKKVLQDIELVLANLAKDPQQIPLSQVELLHNLASTTICEVNTTIERTPDSIQP